MKTFEHLCNPGRVYLKVSLLLVSTFLFLSSSYGQVKEGSKPKDFSSTGQAEVARGDLITTPGSFTQVKHTLTILFGSAKASLGNNLGNVNEPLNGIWVGAIRAPADMLGGSRPALLAQTIRGSIHKDEGARVTVLLNLGDENFLSGQNYVIEFPFGKKLDEDFTREFMYKSKRKSFRTYTATIVVIIERRDPKVLAEVSIDGLDVLNRQDSKPVK
jgi:hypothetical protein